MVFLLERAKLVVEGAGAVGVAALLGGRLAPADAGGTDGRDPLGRQRRRRAAGGDRPPPREPGRAAARAAGPPARPPRLAGAAAVAGRRAAARTCSTSSTSARASTCTCARPRCSSCSRRAGPRTRERGAPTRSARPATPSRARCGRRASVPYCALLDQRADHAAALVGLGMPLHAEHEPPPGRLDRLGEVVERRVPGDLEPSPISSTPWWWWDLVPWSSSPAARAASEPGSRRTSWSEPSKLPGLRRCSSWPTLLGQVLAQRAAEGDVEQLHPAADAEHRHVALDRAAGQRELGPVALGHGAGGLGMAARRRRRRDRCRRRRRGSGRRSGRAPRRGRRSSRASGGIISASAAGALDRRDVAEGEQRGLRSHTPQLARVDARCRCRSPARRVVDPICAPAALSPLDLAARRLRAARRRTRRSAGTCTARSRA